MSKYKLNVLLFPALLLLSPGLVNAQVARHYDVVIDELLPDPSPPVGLPNSEFIELKNRAGFPINLRNWKVRSGSGTATIIVNYLLQPDSFVVICAASVAGSFSAFGPVIGVSSFPSLNNDEDVISLISPESTVIHAVGYEFNWFDNALKSEGGWTLEMIDTGNPCGPGNWKSSVNSKGGTPGIKNSVDGLNPDRQPPALVRSYTIDSLTIVAAFDEPLDSNQAVETRRYIIDNGIGSPIGVLAKPPMFKEVQLSLGTKLSVNTIYRLKVLELKDCSGNTIGQYDHTRAGLPLETDTMELIVNEILFNPRPDGVDYVELYNRSDKIFDASALYIANRGTSGAIGSIKKMSEAPFLIFPGDYITLTEDRRIVQQQYVTKNSQWLLELNSMPSFPDNTGTLVLLNRQGKIIEELRYDERWHFALIDNKEGIALERIDPGKPAQSPENWTSAASTVGYGTPTYLNSQFKQAGEVKGGITISPKIFSPDNDGMDDICFINYQFSEPNFVANLSIFDANGRLVRHLYRNATLSQKGYLVWDGLDERAGKLPVGIYIIFAEVFNLNGKIKKFKSTITLAKKF